MTCYNIWSKLVLVSVQ